MSKIRAAVEMMKNLPGRANNVGLKVTGKPRDLLEEAQLRQLRESMAMSLPGRGAPGGLTGSLRAVPRDLSKGEMLGITTGLGLGGGLGVSDLTEGFTESAKLENSIFANPEEIGRQAARAKMSLEELMDKARQEAERIGQVPQIYFLQIQGGYQDEINRQQEQEPQRIYDEDIDGGAKPVSLFMAGGGEASSQHMMPDGTPMPGSNHQEYEAMMMQQRQMMAGGGTPFPDLTGDGQITQADILKGRGVYAVGGEAIGDELEGMEMTEEQAMAELEESRGEFEQLQMLADVVKKLLNEGMGEAEIVAYLKEQGLDDEDIETLFSFLQEISGQESSMEQAPQGIDQQLQGMM